MARAARIIALTLFLVGSAMFFYGIFLRNSNPGASQMFESFGLMTTALALAIGMATKRRGPGN